MSNAAEMERAGPRMKIDEPKTPYAATSENGSSTSGSAHQSPPESPSFIPRDQLVGFGALEQKIDRAGNASDGASSTGSGSRCVHISDDNLQASGGSSPRSRELFAARRKAHYRNEARVKEWIGSHDGDVDDGTATVNAALNADRLADSAGERDNLSTPAGDLRSGEASDSPARASDSARQNGGTRHGRSDRQKPRESNGPISNSSKSDDNTTNGYADSVCNGHGD